MGEENIWTLRQTDIFSTEQESKTARVWNMTGILAHTCSPSTQEMKQKDQKFKFGHVWWPMPWISALIWNIGFIDSIPITRKVPKSEDLWASCWISEHFTSLHFMLSLQLASYVIRPYIALYNCLENKKTQAGMVAYMHYLKRKILKESFFFAFAHNEGA